MSKVKFTRKGKTIRNIETGKSDTLKSVNLAKKESLRIQMSEDGVLGRGSVELIK